VQDPCLPYFTSRPHADPHYSYLSIAPSGPPIVFSRYILCVLFPLKIFPLFTRLTYFCGGLVSFGLCLNCPSSPFLSHSPCCSLSCFFRDVLAYRPFGTHTPRRCMSLFTAFASVSWLVLVSPSLLAALPLTISSLPRRRLVPPLGLCSTSYFPELGVLPFSLDRIGPILKGTLFGLSFGNASRTDTRFAPRIPSKE